MPTAQEFNVFASPLKRSEDLRASRERLATSEQARKQRAELQPLRLESEKLGIQGQQLGNEAQQRQAKLFDDKIASSNLAAEVFAIREQPREQWTALFQEAARKGGENADFFATGSSKSEEEKSQVMDMVLKRFTFLAGQQRKTSRTTATDAAGRRRFIDSGELAFPEAEVPEQVSPRERLDFERTEQERLAGKLSSPAENALISAQDAAQASDTAVSELLSIANEFESLDPETATGFSGRMVEAFKNFLGGEDDLTRIRKRYNQIVNNQVMQNLPPGVASDKDIEIAFSGFLKDTADTETTAAFLRGLAKIERINGQFNSFKSDWISENGNTRGMFKAWKDQLSEGSQQADQSLEATFQELVGEGKTPEEAARILKQEGFQ